MKTKIAAIAWFSTLCAIAAPRAVGPVTLSVPGRASANVSMASDGSFVAVVWSASTPTGITDVYAATSHDNGATFSPPIRVNATAGDARTNGEQPPRVALVTAAGKMPEVAVLWTSRRGATTMLLSARSGDGGRTFGPTVVVPGTAAAGNRGWQAIGARAGGDVYGVWLDHRRQAEQQQKAQGSGTHQHGGMDAQLSELYFARLDGRSTPTRLTGGVCYCCKTAIATGRGGEIYLAWRHVYPGNLRDMAFTASRDGGRSFRTPVRISEDKWAVEGCPEDGPALAVDARNHIHAVWSTVVMEAGEPVKALFHAASSNGESFTPRDRLPTEGQANHPQMVMADDGSLAVAWDESGGGIRRLAFARGVVDDQGRARFERRTPTAPELGVYPAITITGDGLLAGWTSGEPSESVIRVGRIK